MANDYYKRILRTRKDHLKNIDITGKKILGIYQHAAKDLADKLAKANPGSLRERWVEDYKRQLAQRIDAMRVDLGKIIRTGIYASGALPGAALGQYLDDALNLLGVGASFSGMFSQLPEAQLRAILDGRMYRDGKSLSRRIWSLTAQLQGNIEETIAQGIAQHMSARELAKALNDYVNPDARSGTRIDYNAQRLARTSINQAYWAANVEAAKKNPFCQAMHWGLSPSHYERQVARFGEDVCDTYAAHDEGLGMGNWPIKKLPMPHAMCLCHQYQVVPDLGKVASRLGNWLDGKGDAGLEAAFGAWREGQGLDGANRYSATHNGIHYTSTSIPNAQILQQVQQCVDRATTDFPALRNALEGIVFGRQDGIAACVLNGGRQLLSLDSNAFANQSSLLRVLQDALSSGHSRNVSNPMSIIMHELGHAIDNALAMQRIGVTTMSYADEAAFLDARSQIEQAAYLAAFGSETDITKIYAQIDREMGWRARQNPHEFIAQAVAMWYYGEGDHPISDAVVGSLQRR